MACLVALALGLVGCGDQQVQRSQVDVDCLARLKWKGLTYEGVAVRNRLPEARRLGEGILPACQPEPARTVAVAGIRDVDPSIAVVLAASPQAHESDEVWLGPGYLAQSPLHPLQDEMRAAESWRPTTYREEQWHCQAPRLLRVRVRERPAATSGQIRVTADKKTAAFIRGDDVDTYLVIEPRTAFVGLSRHDVPFIDAGIELGATVRECLGDEDDPGLRGLRLIVAARLSAVAKS